MRERQKRLEKCEIVWSVYTKENKNGMVVWDSNNQVSEYVMTELKKIDKESAKHFPHTCVVMLLKNRQDLIQHPRPIEEIQKVIRDSMPLMTTDP